MARSYAKSSKKVQLCASPCAVTMCWRCCAQALPSHKYNLRRSRAKAMCSPETESSTNLLAHYSDIMTNAIVSPNVTSLAYSELSVVADGGKCEPGANLPGPDSPQRSAAADDVGSN